MIKRDVISLISKIVKAYPNNICIEKGNNTLNYKEFWLKCTKFSNYLRVNANHKTPVVAILEQKTEFDYIAIIGTIMSGGCYVPIKKMTPKKLINEILINTNANFILSNKVDKDLKTEKIKYINEKKINKEKKKTTKLKKTNIAYIMFTSGTTASPKGVIILKKSLNNYVSWLIRKFKIRENYNFSQIPSIGFDLSLADIFLSLCSGGRLIIPEDNDLLFLGEWLHKKKINHLVCTPSLIDYIRASEQLTVKNFQTIKRIFFCGEALYLNHLKNIFKVNKRIKIINAYGPTEATCSITSCDLDIKNYKRKNLTSISIGKPINNMEIKIFNKDYTKILNRGEFLISGTQLSIGYLNNKIITNEKFIKFDGKKYYKTGDYGCFKNKEYYFLSRKDDQIKINGFRVELNEIDNVLQKYGFAKSITIFFKKDIISFVETSLINQKKLRKFLKNNLESYKIPKFFINIKKIPLNTNNKIDINYLKKKYLKNEI